MEGLQVIADLHGGDTDDPIAMTVYQEIRDKVREVVCISHISKSKTPLYILSQQRESGEGRSYRQMWKKYKRRVLLAMSSLAFAQLASNIILD